MPVREELRARFAIFNPHNKPVEELPVIYGFNNGGQRDWWNGCLIAESGHGMGGHVCSNEQFMYGDLGILEGSRPDRHAMFREHYPDGYRMDFVPKEEVMTHPGLEWLQRPKRARIPHDQACRRHPRTGKPAHPAAEGG